MSSSIWARVLPPKALEVARYPSKWDKSKHDTYLRQPHHFRSSFAMCGGEAAKGRTAACSRPLPAAAEARRSGSSRQGCASYEVKVLCRQLPDSDGKHIRGTGR